MALQLITPPQELAVSLEEAKQHLRVKHSSQDDLITRLIKSSTQLAENFMVARKVVPQVWDVIFDRFSELSIQLPIAPVLSVDSVNYYDPDTEVETILDDQEYRADIVSEPAWIMPGINGWPATFDTMNAVRIRVTAGYGETADSPPVSLIPEDIKTAILLILAHHFQTPEAVNVGNIVNEVPLGARDILQRYRLYI